MIKMFVLALFTAVLMLAQASFASQVIEFQEDDLATESVLPIFDETYTVRNRFIVTEGKVEFGILAGMSLNEPFYNPINYSFQGTYHLDELHGVNFTFLKWADGLSTYGKQLRNGDGLTAPSTFDPLLAPHRASVWLASYQYTAYYGKISLGKQLVSNMSFFGLAGAGQITIRDASEIALNLGVGQKFYFSKSWALRLDLRFLLYSAVDPTTASLPAGNAEKAASEFSNRTYIDSLFSFGLVGLF